MNGNKLPKKFRDKTYDRTLEGQYEALLKCCDGTGEIKPLRTRA